MGEDSESHDSPEGPMRRIAKLYLGVALATLAGVASAQGWPSKQWAKMVKQSGAKVD